MRPSNKRLVIVALSVLIGFSTVFWTSQPRRVAAQDSGTIVAETGFKPEKDGFSFPNYSGVDKPYINMTAAEVHRMFGDTVCEPGTESEAACTLIPPAQQWMETTNSEMDGGHCGGMAILSELIYSKKIDLGEFSADSTVGISFNDKIQREIAYWWGTNAVPTKQDYKGKPSEIVDKLIESFKSNDETYSLEVWKSFDSGEGHAITPFAVQDMGNGIVNILAYDNNAPKEVSRVEVDRNAETWRYNLSVNPSVEPTWWEGNADSQTMYLALNTPRLAVQDPPFDLSTASSWQNTGALLRPNTFAAMQEYNGINLTSESHLYADLLITDDQGHKFGYQGGKAYTEIPGAFIQHLPNAGKYDTSIEPIYYVPVGIKFTITLDGSALKQEALNDLVMIGPGYSLALDGIKVKPGDKDSVVFSPDGTEIAYTPSDAEAPNISVGVEHQGADYEFNILGSDVDKGGTINVKLDYNQGTLMLHTTGNQNAASYDLAVDRYDNATTQSYEATGLSLEPAETVYIEFGKWDGKGDLSYGIDEKSDGSIDKTDTKVNQKK